MDFFAYLRYLRHWRVSVEAGLELLDRSGVESVLVFVFDAADAWEEYPPCNPPEIRFS